MTPEELKRLEEVERLLKSLSNNATIPFDIGKAMKARILSDAGVAATSSKLASSENQTVNEAGATPPYTVLKSPDAFLEITLLGNIYYIPVYT